MSILVATLVLAGVHCIEPRYVYEMCEVPPARAGSVCFCARIQQWGVIALFEPWRQRGTR